MALILDEFGKPYQRKRDGRSSNRVSVDQYGLIARYDAAQPSSEMDAWWSLADSAGPNRSNSENVRETIRNRARYESTNNSYCAGILSTLANDCIGRGPRLHMKSGDPDADIRIENDFKEWCWSIGLAEKLRILRFSKGRDGESFGLAVTNRRLEPVTLDLKVFEADLCRNPFTAESFIDPQRHVDGVELDDNGHPLRYFILNEHPHDGRSVFGPNGGEWLDATEDGLFHLANFTRPGQVRGVSEIAPALNLFAILRRYTLAVLGAAESAADLAVLLKTTGNPACEEIDEFPEDFLRFPLQRRGMMNLPFGWDAHGFRGEQPTTTYPDFKSEILNEIARCLNMPFNIAAGNSAGYNYSSGRLDHQTYFKAVKIERLYFEQRIVEPLFRMWLREYLSATSGIAPSDIDLALYPHRFFWDAFEHVDPQKEVSALTELWNTGLVSDEEILLEHRAVDPEKHWRSVEDSIERRKRLGLPLPGIATQTIQAETTGTNGQQQSSQTEEAPQEAAP